jgi:hypothetical protein
MAREWDLWVEQARAADILSVARSLGASLKPSGPTEWIGACPICGGKDRFSVNTRKRLFNCRGSEGGDVFKLVTHCRGCDFIEAGEFINGTPRPDHTRDENDDDRQARVRAHASRMADLERRNKEDLEQAEAHQKREEEHVHRVLERATPIWDTLGERYMRETRGLNPPRRLVGDIRFVAELDYWGYSDNGSGDFLMLATLPAVIALIRDFAGSVIGVSQTYLDPKEPKKWTPPNSARNKPTKVRGEKKGGMIRLGRIGETLAVAEGWVNALSWFALGEGPENVTLAAAVDLGNLSGRAGQQNHPNIYDRDGKARRMQNGEPDMNAPGMILPEGVTSLILLADYDSEVFATAGHLRTTINRFVKLGIDVDGIDVWWPKVGLDFNDMLLEQIRSGDA